MIPNGGGRNHKLSALLTRIRSKHSYYFYCLNCLHSFATEDKHKTNKVCENKDFCNVVISTENTKVLGLNQYQKFDKAVCI